MIEITKEEFEEQLKKYLNERLDIEFISLSKEEVRKKFYEWLKKNEVSNNFKGFNIKDK